MPHEPPKEVTVRVKVPPGHILSTTLDEFSLGSLSTSLPVSALRQRIQTLVPSHPLPVHQRILFGGRALIDDAQSLADALNIRRDPSQTEYVVHLLIRDGAEHVAHEHAPLQPQPVQGFAAGLPGMRPFPQMPQPFQMQVPSGVMNVPGIPALHRPGGGVGNQELGTQQPQPSPAANPQTQPATAGRPHHHHHHHHHHPHTHPGMHRQSPGPQVNGQPLPQRPVSGQDFHLEGVGPTGERFSIHRQTVTVPAGIPGQRMDMPHGGVPGMNPHAGQPLPFGFMPPFMMPGAGLPGFPLPMPMPMPMQLPGQNQTALQPPTVSALDRARENMAEMRRMVDILRAENDNEQTRSHIATLERNIEAVNSYIDPFRVAETARPRSNPPADAANVAPNPTVNTAPAPSQPQHLRMPPIVQIPYASTSALKHSLPLPLGPFPLQHLMQQRPPSQPPPGQITAYLLSSPEGPRALVITPEHGRFTGNLPAIHMTTSNAQNTSNALTIPTVPQDADANAPQDPVQPLQQQPNVAGQNAAQQGDPLALLQPFMGHVWLLLRIMIFAYFLLGSDLGWRRPIALALIGLGFWMIRTGLFGEGGIIRRWWDGIVQVDDLRQRLLRGRLQRMGIDIDAALARGAAANAAAAQAREGQQQQGQERPFPTPEELAERLVRERRRNDPLYRLREQLRPLERGAALFAASLWPGVGERYVQALDRAREEEEAEVRREAEAQQQREAQAQAMVEETKDTSTEIVSATNTDDQKGEGSASVEQQGGSSVSPSEKEILAHSSQ